jgi:hypothetical protein
MIRHAIAAFCLAAPLAAASAPAQAQVRLAAATLPTTRSVEAGEPATVFATLLNSGSTDATACRVALDTGYSGAVPVSVTFQTTDAANALTGTPGAPVDIPAGDAQTFLITLETSGVIAAREIGLAFICDQGRAPVTAGANTVRLTATAAPGPDVIAIAATASGDGVLRADSPARRGAMAVAALNIGAPARLIVRPGTGVYQWPVELTVCETAADGRCLQPAAASMELDFNPGAARTFTVFARGDDRLGTPLLPDIARVFLNFETLDGIPAGATSAALTAPDPDAAPRPVDISAAAAQAFASGARALLVMRDGEVLHEAYQGFGAPNRREVLNSGTKSFSCLLAGAARDDGLFNPDDYAFAGITAWAPDGSDPASWIKQDIRGRDLIALSHGLPPGQPLGDISGINSYGEALDATPVYRADRDALYGRSGFQAFAALFELRTGGSRGPDGAITGGLDPASYLDTRILGPLGAAPDWNRDRDGKPNFSAGARLTAREWARFGRLILDDGVWDGQRLLTRSSVRRCLHYATPAYLGYGLGFWLNRDVEDSFDPTRDALPNEVLIHMPSTGRALPAAPPDMVTAWGAFNMQMHLIPSEGLVIVKFGGTGDQNAFFAALFPEG